LTRPDSSFPVSRPQGVANWEAAPEPLISKDLLFPSTLDEKNGSGKLKSVSSGVNIGDRKQLFCAPPIAIQRRYEPDPGALHELVEALYRLLADPASTQHGGHAEDVA